jgi:hypothetical protein
MAISLSNYVNITSGVGGATAVSSRNLGGMVITDNALCPTGAMLGFSTASSVGDYFGTTSEEYARAVFYFGWISKNISQPQKLNFYFWNENAATGSKIFGKKATYALGTFTPITNGDFTLTLGGATSAVTGLDFSGDVSLSDVAGTVQAAIRAIVANGAAWTGATVTFDATNGRFNLVSGATGADTVAVVAGTTNDCALELGWLTGAVLSNGTAASTIASTLASAINVSNDFGSFCFASSIAPSLSVITEAANWNNSLTPNIQFIFSAKVTAANASSWASALGLIGGCTLTLDSPVAGEHPEMIPMMILAATDYSKRNSVQNFMFQIFNITPSVTTDANAALYDGLGINYYGQTQTAGQLVQFYQRGTMYGISTNPLDQNTYANEIWLKDAIGAQIMTLLLALSKVSANSTGKAQLTAIIQSIITQALTNGTISVGKPLSAAQKLYITNATGSDTAWYQVQTSGYWFDCQIVTYVESSVTKYKAIYTLIYSKDDVIRKVEGTDILI